MTKRRGNPNWGSRDRLSPWLQPSLNSRRSFANSICNPTSTFAQPGFAIGRAVIKTRNTFPNAFLRHGGFEIESTW